MQSLSRVLLSPCVQTPWTAARQACLSITNSWSLLKLMSVNSDAIQPSHPLSSSSPPAFSLSQHQGLSHFSRVQLFGTLWTVACQAPLSMGFSRQEYWSGCHFFLRAVGIFKLKSWRELFYPSPFFLPYLNCPSLPPKTMSKQLGYLGRRECEAKYYSTEFNQYFRRVNPVLYPVNCSSDVNVLTSLI